MIKLQKSTVKLLYNPSTTIGEAWNWAQFEISKIYFLHEYKYTGPYVVVFHAASRVSYDYNPVVNIPEYTADMLYMTVPRRTGVLI